jgi:hypothetical protein
MKAEVHQWVETLNPYLFSVETEHAVCHSDKCDYVDPKSLAALDSYAEVTGTSWTRPKTIRIEQPTQMWNTNGYESIRADF